MSSGSMHQRIASIRTTPHYDEFEDLAVDDKLGDSMAQDIMYLTMDDHQDVQELTRTIKELSVRIDKMEHIQREILTTIMEVKNIIPLISTGAGGPLKDSTMFSPLSVPY